MSPQDTRINKKTFKTAHNKSDINFKKALYPRTLTWSRIKIIHETTKYLCHLLSIVKSFFGLVLGGQQLVTLRKKKCNLRQMLLVEVSEIIAELMTLHKILHAYNTAQHSRRKSIKIPFAKFFYFILDFRK